MTSHCTIQSCDSHMYIHHEQCTAKDLFGLQEVVQVRPRVMPTAVAVTVWEDGGEVLRMSMEETSIGCWECL